MVVRSSRLALAARQITTSAAIIASLTGCSETVIGQAPANVRLLSQHAVDAGPTANSVNWMDAIPNCKRRRGTVALLEQDEFGSFGIPQNANLMLRYLLQKSNCFSVVDRGPALAKIESEQKNVEPPTPAKLRTMDYILTPRVIFQETVGNDASLSGAAAFKGAADGAYSGGWALGFSTRETEVSVVLLLTDARTSLQVLAEQGSATKTDATTTAFGNFGPDNVSGKTAAAALFHAFSRMVARLDAGELAGRSASAKKTAARP